MFFGSFFDKIHYIGKRAIKIVTGERSGFRRAMNAIKKDDKKPVEGKVKVALGKYPGSGQKENDEMAVLKMGTSELDSLFLEKVQLCCYNFNFKDPDLQVLSMKAKFSSLQVILSHIDRSWDTLSAEAIAEVIHMISCNIIRTFPPGHYSNFNLDMDNTILDTSWSHLGVVYNIFLSILDCKNFGPAAFDRKFVGQLLMMFKTIDLRERGFLKWIVYHIYNRFDGMRSFIRKQIYNTFYEFIYVSEEFGGIIEFLWILNTIVDGCFNVPGSGENIEYMFKILLPLHKVKSLSCFHNMLKQSIVQFLLKDPSCIEHVVRGLIKFWPKTCAQKEILFLEEIHEYLNMIDHPEFELIMKPFFTQLAKSMSSLHVEVAEHAMCVLINTHTLALIKPHCDIIMPILCPALLGVTMEHWSKMVVRKAFGVLDLIIELNADLFNELMVKYTKEGKIMDKRQMEHDAAWQKLQDLIESKEQSLSTACIPALFPAN